MSALGKITVVPLDADRESEWLAWRQRVVGGSEAAALFDEHPQISRFELWHRKAGNVAAPDLGGDERVFWGRVLEPAIATGAAMKRGWQIKKPGYCLEAECGLGGSPDYIVQSDARGPGILEIKTADRLVYRQWTEGEPPLGYLIQMQTYLGLSGFAWGAFAILIGGNELVIVEYEPRPKTLALLAAASAEFWASVRSGAEPKADFAADSDTISALYGKAGAGAVDMTGDNYLAALCAVYKAAGERGKEADEEKKAAKAEILTKIGAADRVVCAGFTISAGMVAGTHVSYERKAYRDFRITPKKEKAA